MSIRSMFTDNSRAVKPVTITVDDVEHQVFVGKLSSLQMKRVMQYIKDQDVPMMNAYLVQVGCYEDVGGTRAFGEGKEDLDLILKAPIQLVKAIADQVFEFNRFDVEDATKN